MNGAVVRERWDVFCRVVDHLGDVGIGWRLARQLAGPIRVVRLVVDDLDAFAAIEPRVDASRDRQTVGAIEIRRWPAKAAEDAAAASDLDDVADVVIELLGCGLPPAYLDAMARNPATVWIDYEHLSAEAWVDRFHGMPSPHPSRPLVKHFFYPGFGPESGGLLVEPDVDRTRAAFVADDAAVATFLGGLGVDAGDGSRRLSLFCYADAPVGGLLDALAADRGRRWKVIVPPSGAADAVVRWSADARADIAPEIIPIAMLDQDGYDRLLWTSDVNFVRGEDSFVRAQVAGRPFVWQPYRQRDDAERAKRAAFRERWEPFLPPDEARVERAFWNSWGELDADLSAVARPWLDALPRIATGVDAWRASIVAASPLVERLVAFVDARRGSR